MKNKENKCYPMSVTGNSMVTLLPDEDLSKCWSILDAMQPSEILELSRIPEDRRTVFISCAKQYSDIYGTVCFNSDFTKLKKLHEWKQPTNAL